MKQQRYNFFFNNAFQCTDIVPFHPIFNSFATINACKDIPCKNRAITLQATPSLSCARKSHSAIVCMQKNVKNQFINTSI